MSLVAYDSSDDSNDSDVGDNGETVQINGNDSVQSSDIEPRTQARASADTQGSTAIAFEGHISDDDDELWKGIGDNRSAASTLLLPAPKHAPSSDVIDPSVTRNSAQDVKQPSILQGLPAPKAPDVVEGSVPNTDDVLEDLVKPKPAELAIREKPPEKKRKVIKIAAPSLAQYDSDEDSAPAPKQLKPAKTGSGLFALLPEPKNASKKQTGRSLIPHTLTKKPAAPAKPAPAKPKVIPNVARPIKVAPTPTVNDDSDGEEVDTSGPSNFFSIGAEASSKISQDVPASALVNTATTSKAAPDVGNIDRAVEATVTKPPELDSEQPLEGNNEPLQFNRGATTAHTYVGPQRPSQPMAFAAAEDTEYEAEAPEQEGADSVIPMQELLRLQGRRNRGREEINLIDVQGATGTSTLELMKNLTQETDMSTHSRKNKDQPSTQEKRKHQITYLAHQAKEREFDLKNQWANNRATKKQTQSKYGF